MKQKIASFTILVLVFCFNAMAFAAGKNVQAACSNATLKGAYGTYRTGVSPDGPVAGVGIVFYDGNGHLQSRQRNSTNGNHEFLVRSLEYRVGKDCTYKVLAGSIEIATGVIVDNGNRLFLLSTAPGTTTYSVFERIQK